MIWLLLTLCNKLFILKYINMIDFVLRVWGNRSWTVWGASPIAIAIVIYVHVVDIADIPTIIIVIAIDPKCLIESF